eukprot:tig00000571_g2195.t1
MTPVEQNERAKRRRTPPPEAPHVDALDENICGICIEVACEPIKTPCAHLFDAFCLDQWLERSRGQRTTCPACRAGIPSEVPEVDEALRALIQARHGAEYEAAKQEIDKRRKASQERALAFVSSPCSRHADSIMRLSSEGLLTATDVEAALLAFPRRSWIPPIDAAEMSDEEIYDGTATPLASLVLPSERRAPALSCSGTHGILLEAARIRPGSRVLEVGCGLGLLSAAAALLAGPAGRVEGVDSDSRMARAASEAARRNAAAFEAAGVPAPTFRSASLESLEAGGYDVVIADEPAPPGYEWTLCRLLRPGGALVAPLRGALVRLEKPAGPGGGPCAARPLASVQVIGDGSLRPPPLPRGADAWLACAACGERLCAVDDVSPGRATAGRPRPWMPDGDVLCLGPAQEGEAEAGPSWSGARPLARGPFCPSPPSRLLHCPSCDVLLGRELVAPPGTDPAGPLYPRHYVSAAYAGYFCGVRAGAAAEVNERVERLAQGVMRVADVSCAACAAPLGWRFLRSNRPAGAPLGTGRAALVLRAQEGRYGLVFSRLRFSGSCRCAEPEAPPAGAEPAAAEAPQAAAGPEAPAGDEAPGGAGRRGAAEAEAAAPVEA